MTNLYKRLNQFADHLNPGRFLLWKILGIVIAYTAIVCQIDNHDFKGGKLTDANAAVSFSAIIGLLLIFRNNSAYERWWEGRKLWGQLVNESRNIAVKIKCYADEITEIERFEFGQLIFLFAYELKSHLRGIHDFSALSTLKITDRNQHVPSAIVLKIYENLKRWKKDGKIDHWEQMQLDQHAKALLDICGATERILKSPISGSYKLLLWLGLILNVICLPWFIAPTFHWWSIVLMAVSSYFIFGLELLAEEIERPFDDLPNDLPLDDICKTIQKSTEDILEISLSLK